MEVENDVVFEAIDKGILTRDYLCVLCHVEFLGSNLLRHITSDHHKKKAEKKVRRNLGPALEVISSPLKFTKREIDTASEAFVNGDVIISIGRQYECLLCHSRISGTNNAFSHLTGSQHKGMMSRRLVGKPSSSQAIGSHQLEQTEAEKAATSTVDSCVAMADRVIRSFGNEEYKCWSCKIILSNEDNVNKHVRSSKHQKSMQQWRQNPESDKQTDAIECYLHNGFKDSEGQNSETAERLPTTFQKLSSCLPPSDGPKQRRTTVPSDPQLQPEFPIVTSEPQGNRNLSSEPQRSDKSNSEIQGSTIINSKFAEKESVSEEPNQGFSTKLNNTKLYGFPLHSHHTKERNEEIHKTLQTSSGNVNETKTESSSNPHFNDAVYSASQFRANDPQQSFKYEKCPVRNKEFPVNEEKYPTGDDKMTIRDHKRSNLGYGLNMLPVPSVNCRDRMGQDEADVNTNANNVTDVLLAALVQGIVTEVDPQTRQYQCCVCQVRLSGTDNAHRHLVGASHMKTLSRRESTGLRPQQNADVQEALEAGVVVSYNNNQQYTCCVCKVTLSGDPNVSQHLEGARHQKAMSHGIKSMLTLNPKRFTINNLSSGIDDVDEGPFGKDESVKRVSSSFQKLSLNRTQTDTKPTLYQTYDDASALSAPLLFGQMHYAEDKELSENVFPRWQSNAQKNIGPANSTEGFETLQVQYDGHNFGCVKLEDEENPQKIGNEDLEDEKEAFQMQNFSQDPESTQSRKQNLESTQSREQCFESVQSKKSLLQQRLPEAGLHSQQRKQIGLPIFQEKTTASKRNLISSSQKIFSTPSVVQDSLDEGVVYPCDGHQQYRCSVCETILSGDPNVLQHLEGSKHREVGAKYAIQHLEHAPASLRAMLAQDTVEAACVGILLVRDIGIECTICDMAFSGIVPLESHLVSDAHRKAAEPRFKPSHRQPMKLSDFKNHSSESYDTDSHSFLKSSPKATKSVSLETSQKIRVPTASPSPSMSASVQVPAASSVIPQNPSTETSVTEVLYSSPYQRIPATKPRRSPIPPPPRGQSTFSPRRSGGPSSSAMKTITTTKTTKTKRTNTESLSYKGLPSVVQDALTDGVVYTCNGPQQYICWVCEVTLSGDASVFQHLEGAKHREAGARYAIINFTQSPPSLRMLLSKYTAEAAEIGTLHVRDLNIVCTICDVAFSGVFPLDSHLVSDGHRKTAGLPLGPTFRQPMANSFRDTSFSDPSLSNQVSNDHPLIRRTGWTSNGEVFQESHPPLETAQVWSRRAESSSPKRQHFTKTTKQAPRAAGLEVPTVTVKSKHPRKTSINVQEELSPELLPDQYKTPSVVQDSLDEGVVYPCDGHQQYRCSVCETILSGDPNVLQHLEGSKHREVGAKYAIQHLEYAPASLRAMLAQDTVEAARVGILLVRDTGIECTICDMAFSGIVPLESHLVSDAHRKVAKPYLRPPHRRLNTVMRNESSESGFGSSFSCQLSVDAPEPQEQVLPSDSSQLLPSLPSPSALSSSPSKCSPKRINVSIEETTVQSHFLQTTSPTPEATATTVAPNHSAPPLEASTPSLQELSPSRAPIQLQSPSTPSASGRLLRPTFFLPSRVQPPELTEEKQARRTHQTPKAEIVTHHTVSRNHVKGVQGLSENMITSDNRQEVKHHGHGQISSDTKVIMTPKEEHHYEYALNNGSDSEDITEKQEKEELLDLPQHNSDISLDTDFNSSSDRPQYRQEWLWRQRKINQNKKNKVKGKKYESSSSDLYRLPPRIIGNCETMPLRASNPSRDVELFISRLYPDVTVDELTSHIVNIVKTNNIKCELLEQKHPSYISYRVSIRAVEKRLIPEIYKPENWKTGVLVKCWYE